MVWVWVSLAAEYAISLGLGSAAIYLFFAGRRDDIWRAFVPGEIALIGVLTLALLGTCLHFFVALSLPVTSTIFVPALLFLPYAFWRKWLATHSWIRHALILAFLFFMGSLWATHNETYYDTGLYYLPNINWIRSHPISLGLGNLHSRLGFFSVWPIVTSAFYLPGLGLASSFSSDVFFVIMILLTLIEKALDHGGNLQTKLIALIALTTALLPFQDGLFWRIGSPATDPPVTACAIYCGVLACEWLFSTQSIIRSKARVLIWALALFSVMTKLSGGPLLLFPFFIEIAQWRKQRQASREPIPALTAERRFIVKVAGWLAIGSAPCVLRNLLLTGYLVYPVTAARLGFLPWSMSAEAGWNDIKWVRASARQIGVTDPALVLGNWYWLPYWWTNVFKITEAATNSLVLIAAGAILLLAFSIFKRKWNCHGALAAFVAADLCGIAYWFFNAPDFRFGGGFFYSLANLLLCLSLLAWLPVKPWLAKYSGIAVFLVMLLCLRAESIAGNLKHLEPFAPWPVIPTPTAVFKPIASGQQVLVTTPGDQCWDLPLLCTAYYEPTLRLKDNGHWLVFSH